MGKFGAIIKAIAMIPAVVHGAEAVFGPGNGLSKKDKVLSTVTLGLATAAGILPQDAEAFGQLNNAAGKITDAVVDILNVAKVFKKGSK